MSLEVHIQGEQSSNHSNYVEYFFQLQNENFLQFLFQFYNEYSMERDIVSKEIILS